MRMKNRWARLNHMHAELYCPDNLCCEPCKHALISECLQLAGERTYVRTHTASPLPWITSADEDVVRHCQHALCCFTPAFAQFTHAPTSPAAAELVEARCIQLWQIQSVGSQSPLDCDDEPVDPLVVVVVVLAFGEEGGWGALGGLARRPWDEGLGVGVLGEDGEAGLGRGVGLELARGLGIGPGVLTVGLFFDPLLLEPASPTCTYNKLVANT